MRPLLLMADVFSAILTITSLLLSNSATVEPVQAPAPEAQQHHHIPVVRLRIVTDDVFRSQALRSELKRTGWTLDDERADLTKWTRIEWIDPDQYKSSYP